MDLGVLRRPESRTILVMVVATIFGAMGDTSLSKGMKGTGVVLGLGALPRLVREVVSDPYILAGVGFLALFLVLWLAVLSWADLSVALPLTALSYVFGALLARFYLHEDVTPLRWGGTVVVCLGVALVAKSMKK